MKDDFALKGEVISLLQELEDPASHKNLLDAHLVEKVEVDSGVVEVTLVMPKEVSREVRFQIEDAVYDRLETLQDVKEVKVQTMSPEAIEDYAAGRKPAPSSSAKSASPPAPRSVAPAEPVPGVGKVLAVASGKGGVGKSTVAANLALALAHNGFRVGVLDIDIYGPSLPTLLGIHQKPTVVERQIQPLQAHGLRVMSLGFLMDDDTPVIWRGPIVTGIIRQFLRDVDWSGIDYLVVDMPPGTGDAQLALAQTVPVDGALIVSTPSDLALIDAARGLKMFETLNIPVLGIVENMSVFVCPHCNEATHIFGSDSVAKEADRLHTQVVASIPLDLTVRLGGDQGQPVVVTNPEHPVTHAFIDLASRVVEQLPLEEPSENTSSKPAKKGLFSFLKS